MHYMWFRNFIPLIWKVFFHLISVCTACSMVLVKKAGKTGLVMKVVIIMEKNKDLGLILGAMEAIIMGTGKITKFMGMEFTAGLMAGSMMENGAKGPCMAKGFILGLMEESTMGSIFMIKNKGMELIPGLTGKSTLGTGNKENNME